MFKSLVGYFFLHLLAVSYEAPANLTRGLKNGPDINSKTVDIILKLDDIKRPDHLEGVRLERDGDLNKQFRKEVLMGKNDDKADPKDANKLLEDIFTKADSNSDKELSQDELSDWIALKVKEHLDQAIKENFFVFTAIDKNRNGIVTWKEYHINFMRDQGFSEEYAKDHPENHKGLERKVREQILLDQAAFSEATHSNPDGLNIDEFLSFRHPEHSFASLLNMVQDIFNSLDENNDEMLTDEEFASIPSGHVANEMQPSEAEWKEERKREFHESIDVNHDGKVTRQELLFYSDPKNPAHAKTEARSLINLADEDKSGTLSLQEIIAKKDIFLGSKMVDTAQSFHDEF